MFEALGGRKSFMSFLIIILGTAVHILSAKGVTAEYVSLLCGALAVFCGANAFTTHSAYAHGAAEALGAVADEASGPAQDIQMSIATLADRLNQVEAGMGQMSDTVATVARAQTVVNNRLIARE